MPDSQPRNLRTVRQITRRDILFSVARLPNSDRLLVGSSEGKVFELDIGQPNGEARVLADHGRYVTSVRVAGGTAISGGYGRRLNCGDLGGGARGRALEAHDR